jgi:hypothetical protein
VPRLGTSCATLKHTLFEWIEEWALEAAKWAANTDRMEAVMTSLAKVHGAQTTMNAAERSNGSGFAGDDAQGARQRLISAAQFGKLRLGPAAYESGVGFRPWPRLLEADCKAILYRYFAGD